MPQVTTRDGTKLYVKRWGSGRPVVLIHGWPLSADSWDDIAVPLVEAGFQTIAYDRRGFGRSDQPWSGYDYDTLSDDLADLIKELQLQDASLVGFSMGGGEVARYMSRHGGQGVQSAALIGSVVPFLLKTEDNPQGVESQTFATLVAGLREDRPKFFAEFFRNFFGVGSPAGGVSDEWLEWTRSMAMQASLRATLSCVESFSATDFRPDLASFHVPTLIVHGIDDQIVPIDVSSRAAAEGIPHAQLIEYEGGPHGLFATHTTQLINDLKTFLGGS